MPVGYGMSETASFVTGYPSTTPRAVLRGGGHGYPLPGNEVRVHCPDTGAPVGPGIEGELLVRGVTLMEHYVKQTRDECFDTDGWYRTGDIGFYDDDGVVHWLGRRSEMIKTAGASVSPSEVEVQLQRLESIKLARVIGVPDDRQGQIVVLCVELQAGASVTADEITSFLGERLSSYKIPKHVVFFEREKMPMNGNGAKVQDTQLLDAVRQRLGAR